MIIDNILAKIVFLLDIFTNEKNPESKPGSRPESEKVLIGYRVLSNFLWVADSPFLDLGVGLGGVAHV